jgi:RepB DNA-primase N-terminal domain
VGRCKKDVAIIRHVFLDFDEKGTEAVNALVSRPDIPNPNYLLSSSPGKWQVVWKVQGFGKDEAEQLQRALARDTGADLAATHCARVLRLPGFHNRKYESPHRVTAMFRIAEVYGPENFPAFGYEDPVQHLSGKRRSVAPLHLSQSERDWAYAKRALARGDSQKVVVAAIEAFRQYDKPNPRYYAETSVRKAAAALQAETAERGPARG